MCTFGTYIIVYFFIFFNKKSIIIKLKIFSTLNQFSHFKEQNDANNHLKMVGVNVFYKICSYVDGIQFLFPAAVSCYKSCIEKLGKV